MHLLGKGWQGTRRYVNKFGGWTVVESRLSHSASVSSYSFCRLLSRGGLFRGLFLVVLAAAFLLLQPGVVAQSQFATLSGTVHDSSGAVVVGAGITVKNAVSGETRKTVTNEDGFFTVPTLPAGTYQVTVEMKGFQKWVGSGVVLNGADSRTMNVEMRVGAATESVTVVGTVTQIAQTDSGEKSALISSEDLQNLSLVGRNASEFIKILPGATLAANGGINKAAYSGEVVGINGFCPGNGCNAGGLSAANVNGQSVQITQDGQNTFDPGASGAATPVNPNPNMISEVKVLESNFTSDNPKGPVVVNTVTKSGGSQFHGEAYLYARNAAMDAEDPFNKASEAQAGFAPGSLKGQTSYYYPGFNLGGPILVPGTGFNKSRQRLFFFEGFEYYKQQLDGGVDRAYVPNASMLNGDFSSLATYTGNSNTGTDRHVLYAVPTQPNSSWIGMQARPGCVISGGVLSSACIDPAAQTLMKLILPAPNANPSTTGFNYVQDFPAAQNSWQNMVRGDWNISDNTKVYVTWSRQRETAHMPTGLWVGAADWAVPTPTTTVGANGSDSTTASFVHVFSPTMTSESRFGYTKINFPNSPEDPSKVLRQEANFPLSGIFKNPDIPAVLSWGDSIPNLGDVGHDFHPTMIAYKGIPSAAEDLTKVIKTHTTKYGFYYEHVYNRQDNWGQYMGVFQYAAWAGTPTGNEYADMLMGIGQAGYFEQALPPASEIAQNIAAFYAQDSWKLTRRITVQYGLRFEHYAKPYDADGYGLAIFDPLAYATGTGTNPGVTWNKLNSSTPLSGTTSRLFFYSPRFGAAIDLFGTGKTVVRGGWGRYRAYDSLQSNAYTGPAGTALGSVGWSCGSNDPSCPTWEAIDGHASGNCTATSNCAPPIVFGSTTALANTSFSVMTPHNDEQPLVTSYSLSIDQQLPARFRLEVSYVGNYGQFLQSTANINSVPLGTLNAPGFTCPAGTGNNTTASCQQAFRPFNKYQAITGSVTAGGSQFDSFQATLHRTVGFLTLQANYTFSKAVGDGVQYSNGGMTGALPDFGARWLWGVLPFDRAQAFSAAYVFSLPNVHKGNAFVRGAGNGWQISGITQIESGAQLSAQGPSTGLNFNYGAPGQSNITVLGTPDITVYPIITCNPTQGLQANQFANPKCFSPDRNGVLGTGGLPYMPGPMFWNSDLSAMKTFKLTERKSLQFKFSAFNFLNHSLTTFTNGDNNLKLSFNDVGQVITGTSCPAVTGGTSCTQASTFGIAQYRTGHRVLEMGAKFSF